MKILTDYHGRVGRLTDERVAHIFDHPQMRSMQTALEEALQHPMLAFESEVDSAMRLNHRFYFGTRVGHKWLCVVVSMPKKMHLCSLPTLTDKPKKGRQVWPISVKVWYDRPETVPLRDISSLALTQSLLQGRAEHIHLSAHQIADQRHAYHERSRASPQ